MLDMVDIRNKRWKRAVLMVLWLPSLVWAVGLPARGEIVSRRGLPPRRGLLLSRGVFAPSAGVVWRVSRSSPLVLRKPEVHYHAWARIAAMETGVPERILWGIVQVESGGWPWTLNVDGRPERFSSRAAMLRAARTAVARGTKYLDIGIAQVDWRWNGARFGWSLARAVDPVENLRVAAKLLAKMRHRSGSWLGAIEDYHGGTNWERVNYAQRVVLGDE
ncbi:transglycosylase SLT domain protein [bacterium BMS3Bbin13]|nr:transglycosylase SLT domain protein [bacterium BMS3Bbin13]